MRLATIAAAAVVSGIALAQNADAACDPHHPTGCGASAQQAAGVPLQLKSFMDRGTHTALAKRRAKRATARKSVQRRTEAVPIPRRRVARSSLTSRPLTPKVVPTIAINARALTVIDSDRTAGFSATTAPWQGRSAFAPSDEPELPHGIRIVAADELNEIDRAANAMPEAKFANADRSPGVSLVTPAHAAAQERASRSASAEGTRAWPQRLYDKLLDGVLTAALAIRALFN